MFRKLFIRCGFIYDYKYDWTGNPLVDPPRPPLPRQKGSVKRPPVSARLCPPTPHERRQINADSMCDERGHLVNTCKVRPLSSRQRKSFGSIYDNEFAVPPPLPKKGDRAPRPRNGSMCLKEPPPFEKDYCEWKPVKPPNAKPRPTIPNLPAIPNLHNLNQYKLTGGSQTTRSRSNSMRCSSMKTTSGKSILPAINDIKKTPDPISKQLYNEILKSKQ